MYGAGCGGAGRCLPMPPPAGLATYVRPLLRLLLSVLIVGAGCPAPASSMRHAAAPAHETASRGSGALKPLWGPSFLLHTGVGLRAGVDRQPRQ